MPLGFPGGIVGKIRILIPAGHAGLTGIALGYGGNNVIPTGLHAYYSGDNREVIIDYTDLNPGVSWQALLCNNDLITHVWEVDFDLTEIGVTNGTSTIQPLTVSDILAAAPSSNGAS